MFGVCKVYSQTMAYVMFYMIIFASRVQNIIVVIKPCEKVYRI